MWKPHSRRHVGRVSVLAVITVALVMLGVWVGAAGPSSFHAGGQETEPLRVDVTLDEYSFSTDPGRVHKHPSNDDLPLRQLWDVPPSVLRSEAKPVGLGHHRLPRVRTDPAHIKPPLSLLGG